MIKVEFVQNTQTLALVYGMASVHYRSGLELAPVHEKHTRGKGTL